MYPGDSWCYPRLLLFALTAVLVLTVVVAGATSTTAFGAYTQTWEGASELHQLAGERDVPTDLVRNVSTYPENGTGTVAVILSPATGYSQAERGRIAQFVNSGGTLLVAEDFRPNSNTLLRDVGAESRFDGRLVRDERHYASGPAFPVAINVSEHPLTNQSDSLTLNHGTVLDPSSDATVLVRTSGFAYLDINRNSELDDTETLTTHPVVATEQVGDGTVILVSDPSIFINAMLERDGNRAFAVAVIESGDRLLVDTSHTAGGLPPIRLGLLVLRETPVLAFLVGGLAILGIWGWDYDSLPDLPWPGSQDPPEVAVSRDRLLEGVRNRHPDWDPERVERVVQALMSENAPEEGND